MNSRVSRSSRQRRKVKERKRSLCLLGLRSKRIKKAIGQLGTSLTRSSEISSSRNQPKSHCSSTSMIK